MSTLAGYAFHPGDRVVDQRYGSELMRHTTKSGRRSDYGLLIVEQVELWMSRGPGIFWMLDTDVIAPRDGSRLFCAHLYILFIVT